MKSFTYLALNLAFMGIAWLIIRQLNPKSSQQNSQHTLIAIIILYLLMVGFNTYLTSLAIVRYDWQKVLGFKILSWPIEDIAYLVVALYAAPIVWRKFQEKYAQPESTPQPITKTRRPAKSQRKTARRSRRKSTR